LDAYRNVVVEMNQIYGNPKNPGSLGGIDRLRKAANVSRREAVEYLEGKDEYTVNKERRTNFKRNPIIVTNLQQQYQMDLADMSKYKNENDGTTFLLVAVDCFSSLASVRPMKNKSGKEMILALKKVFDDMGEPEKIQTDKGTEFHNRDCKKISQR